MEKEIDDKQIELDLLMEYLRLQMACKRIDLYIEIIKNPSIIDKKWLKEMFLGLEYERVFNL